MIADKTWIDRQRGFTLIELAMVLMIVGTMISLYSSNNYQSDGSGSGQAGRKADQLNSAALAINTFASATGRLPCADTNGDGFEGAGSGCGADSAHAVGGLPYKTMGIAETTALKNGEVMYGVYRNSGIDADLAVNKERTGDIAVTGSYQNLGDLRKALTNITSTTDKTRVYVTGDGGYGGDIDCNSQVTNVAFVVVSAGSRDADEDGVLFDGVNNEMRWPNTGDNCFASPHQAESRNYDDQVKAVSVTELLGLLTTQK